MDKNNKYIKPIFTIFAVGITALLSHFALGHFYKFDYWKIDSNQEENANISFTKNEISDEGDTLKFPIKDNKTSAPGSGDTTGGNSFDLKDPKNLKTIVEYDPDSNSYNFLKSIGGYGVKPPASMSFEEYYKYKSRQDEAEYFHERLNALSMFNQKPELPALYKEGVFDRLFGSKKIEIKPQGNLVVNAGVYSQYLKNPSVSIRNQKYTNPDFDMQMNVNLMAKIGDKMKMNISNNTLSSFGEMNEMRKLEYTGKEDEIIKKIELGNTSFPLKSALTPGVSSLFGIKVQSQWGKLWMTNVLSQQKSQRKSISTQGGELTQKFEIPINDYEENRHFLIGQYFYNNYDKALKEFPIINSQVMINKMEVWITNRTGATQGIRDALAFMDLGEADPFNTSFKKGDPNALPDNRANTLYDELSQSPLTRQQATASQGAIALGLKDGEQFNKVMLRKLNENEYRFDPRLGYISLLSTSPNQDDIIAVAYRYTYNGKVFQVGEFSEDLPPDSASQKIIFLKLLKGTKSRVNLPIWNLMMKNIYSIRGMNIAKDKFRLNVVYQDPGGGNKRFLPDGPSAGQDLLSLLNLDRLNANNDPYPDGVFDFVDSITIDSKNGKIIFPTLQPFGKTLKAALGNNPALERKYLYQVMYDSTKSVALQQQQNNRFLIKGEYQYSGGGSEIRLNGFNIPQGSVIVSAGGQTLVEGTDYQVDYSMGSVRILNQGILQSGVPINVSYEDQGTFGQNTQNFTGTRLDYYVNDKLSLGATYMRLTERPYSTKISSGYDPVSNTVLAGDVNYQSESKWLTKLVDKLPFYSTSAPSLISGSAEIAGIFPGHSKFVNRNGDEGGTNYVDDFEGASSAYDIRYPVNNWSLSSVPFGAIGPNNNNLFPESVLTNDLRTGMNRAKLSWYNIEPMLNEMGINTPQSVKEDTSMQDYWRQVLVREVFPNRDVSSGMSILTTLDLAYNPKIRGPYNFDANNIDPSTGELLNPSGRWGGIQRALDQSDFEQNNVEYINFWVLDPFINKPDSKGGYLYFNLGDVSEDVLKDSRMSFENGIPYPKDYSKLDETPWGYVPSFQQQIVRAFNQDPNARATQDVGYDEMDDAEEATKFGDFLNQIAGVLGQGSPAYEKLMKDPSSDNFMHFFDPKFNDEKAGVITRYRDFNNPQGNSPVLSDNAQTNSSTIYPESEDINKDNSLNETEAYYQYRIKLEPNMAVGTNYIVDKQVTQVTLPDRKTSTNTWYQFKVPVKEFSNAVGGISDFRSIRFVRMFLTGFEEQTVLRFAQLQFDRSIWRRYDYSLVNPGEHIPESEKESTSFGLTSVNVEENGKRTPIPYMSPPGVDRQEQRSTTGEILRDNEQSLSLQVCNLKDGDARAAIKEFGISMRQFKQLKMNLHAESVVDQPELRDGDLVAFIRIGSDYVRNYYEYQIPLKVSIPRSGISREEVWPEVNEMVINLEDLVNLKNNRNISNASSAIPFQGMDRNGNIIKVIGSPNTAEVKNVMVGILNPKKSSQNPQDDGLPKCGEVWFNELRNVGSDERAGYAATAQINAQLADLGTVHLGGNMHTKGYGSISDRVNERARDDYFGYEGNANLNLGKLLPNNWGIQLPVFVGYAQNVSNPEYDPYDLDVVMGDRLKQSHGQDREEFLRAAQDFTSITSFNINNFKILGNPNKQSKKPMPWSLKNFALNYAYQRQFSRNPLIEGDDLTNQNLSVNYTYSIAAKPFEPFKKSIKSKSKWLLLIKDFNISYLPNSFSFNNSLVRNFNETILRDIDKSGYEMPPYYYKNFVWNRDYNLNWNLTRSLSINYMAHNASRIDEPYGRINTASKRDSLWDAVSNFGRNTFYNQSLDLSYKLPTNKIPLLDWTTVNLKYNATFNWTAASLLAIEQGNIITNTQLKQLNGSLNFKQLYQKNRFLREANMPVPKKNNNNPLDGLKKGASKSIGDIKGANGEALSLGDKNKKEEKKTPKIPAKPVKKTFTEKDVKGSDTMKSSEIRTVLKTMRKAEKVRFRNAMIAWRKAKNAIAPEMNGATKTLLQLATMVKTVNVDYSETAGTILPGFMDSTSNFGANLSNRGNGYDFALGYQPGNDWIQDQIRRANLSRDSLFNGMMQQNFNQRLDIKAALEPISNFRIDLNWSKNFSRNQSFINKFNNNSGAFEELNPYYTGTFDVTYIGIKTMFGNSDPKEIDDIYNQFLNNRNIVSNRLGNMNPYTNGTADPNDPNYAKGYTRYAQDVLIPSFIAAYTGQNAKDIPLIQYDRNNLRSNPFKFFFPKPNWKITYTGLSDIEPFASVMNSFTLNHKYDGAMAMNSFVNSLYYLDPLGVGFPAFIDSNSNNYIPFFQVPNLTIRENFAPIVGFDAAFKNDLSIKVNYLKSRTVSLSLIDFQVSETKSSTFEFGLGYRVRGLLLPFSVFGVRELKNDLNIRCDIGFRNDFTTTTYIAQNEKKATMGQRVLTLMPTADYIINDNLQLQLYVDYKKSNPWVETSFPLRSTRAGVRVTYTFTD
ncbi:MAG TPA: cell surface protein SprA [Edaphocola sp.]|nr:cell surface protein SprA [Edaphocola sp.]